MKKPPTSIFKKFFIAAILFFIAAIGFASYMFFNGTVSVSNENIDIIVLGNAFTKGGEELPLQVEIVNRNKANLELANLVIEYPRGANDSQTDLIRLPHDSIGTIKPGQSITRNIKVFLFGAEKSIRNVKIQHSQHLRVVCNHHIVFLQDWKLHLYTNQQNHPARRLMRCGWRNHLQC